MKPGRRAYSLIELMLVLTITSALLGVCVQTLFLILPVAESAKGQLEQTGVLMTLGERFRRDAHEAIQVTDVDGQSLPSGKLQSEWVFNGVSGETIHYRVDGEKLVRDATIAGGQAHHEAYVLPDAAVTGLELSDVGEKHLAALLVKPQENRTVRIEALVGSHAFEPTK